MEIETGKILLFLMVIDKIYIQLNVSNKRISSALLLKLNLLFLPVIIFS